MMDDSGKAMDVYHHPVLETDTVIECNNARETSLVAEVKASNGKRIADFVVTKVEGVPKTSIIKKFYCYMYGYDPRFKK